MLDQFPNITSGYEVVKTVGFDWERDGHRFTLRVDVVRLMGDEDLAPMIWQVADAIGDVLLVHTRPEKSPIRAATPEEVIAAVIRSLEEAKAEPAEEAAPAEGEPAPA